MTEIGKIRTTSYESNADGTERPVRLNRRGELVAINPFMQAVADKRVFIATIGSASTPVSFAKTAYDADQPQLSIDTPAGTTIIPLQIDIWFEDTAGTDNEVILLASGTAVGGTTATAVTPVNQFIPSSGAAPASVCTVYSLYTGNGTDPNAAPYFEFYRYIYAFTDAANDPEKHIRWSALNNIAPIIQGTGSLVVYIVGSTAPAGYLRAMWMEIPDSDV